MSKPVPRPGLLEISPYTPGKSTGTTARVHKLSSNESALGASPNAIAAYERVAAKLERYPDGNAVALREAIGEVYGVAAANIVVGAGSDEIITLLIRAYAAEGDNIVQSAHGFSYYHLAAASAGVETRYAPEKSYTADIDAIADTVDDRTRIVFLANPNSPTGTVLMGDVISRLRAMLPPHVILVLDGAYAEYMDDPLFSGGDDLVREAMATGADNVVMMRTFSKIYGLGGLRVGWAFAPDGIIDILNRIRPPFSVNAAGLAAAEAAVRDQAFASRNRQHNAKERARVARALSAFGFAVVPPYGNFILFGMPEAAEQDDAAEARMLLSHLESEGVLIRSAASSGLPGHLRVSIGNAEANDAFLAGLGNFVTQRRKTSSAV